MPKDKILEIINLLKNKNYTISIAESCTGGMLTSMFVNVSGISQFLIEGLVTYSNESKIKRLGIKKAIIEKFGAVSKETVEAMLSGLNTNTGIAVSGIAGPEGGTIDKPVGTVFIGVKILNDIIVRKFFFYGKRNIIRVKSCKEAIKLLLIELEKRVVV